MIRVLLDMFMGIEGHGVRVEILVLCHRQLQAEACMLS